MFRRIATVGMVVAGISVPAAFGESKEAPPPKVNATFVQLSRKEAARSVDDWRALLKRMQAVNIRRVYVQWTADYSGISYFERLATYRGGRQSESYPAIERLFDAASGSNMEIVLGLEHDPEFWTRITARGKTLRDYLLIRSERQRALLAELEEKFGDRKSWVGIYIPDEIDDVSWRSEKRQELFRLYLKRVLEQNQDLRKRTVSISAFGKGRTAPRVLRKYLDSLFQGAGVDLVLFQDGGGADDPPVEYLGDYLRALTAGRGNGAPKYGIVLEAFTTVSASAGEFKAVPAKPESLQKRLRESAGLFDEAVLFAFPQYVDFTKGPQQKALYDLLSGLK